MRKTVVLIIFILLVYYGISLFIQKNNIVIPNESIRIRILANSNKEQDQNTKKMVSNNLMYYLNKELINVKDIDEARNKIGSSINNINLIVSKTLENNNTSYQYKINYGYNYFPQKEFKDKKYKEGYYESLLVTLGDGLGDNFWCLLFPPLCLLDESNIDNLEYSSFFNEIFKL